MTASARWCLCALVAFAAGGRLPAQVVVFEEGFSDPALPAWRAEDRTRAATSVVPGPEGATAVMVRADTPGSFTYTHALPVESLAGKGVLLDVWRKADKIQTGAAHYLNAKAMLSWKAESAAKPTYSTTQYSDFSGTFDWERHRYVVEMPVDLEWANVTIGLQACTGAAGYAKLVVAVDPRFPTQAALQRYLLEEERAAYANLDPAALSVSLAPGGTVTVSVGRRHVPRVYWTDAVREAVLAAAPGPIGRHPGDARVRGFRDQLLTSLSDRAEALAEGLGRLSGPAASDRVYEIASLRARCEWLAAGGEPVDAVHMRADATRATPVPDLLFGNNINAEHLGAAYDVGAQQFQAPFLERVRPMGITFLRYPGGCNADVFDWRHTIGPLEQRRELINYHNGSPRGIATFGVDEFLRFCESEAMVPILTTAFCKDNPARVDPREHPKGVRHPFVFDYAATAPDRVALAAEWVEYCNGSTESPMGRLRAENGHAEPYGVTHWEVGNESYGPDPLGSCTAEEYARAFPAYAAAMKQRDPSITVMLNGSPDPEWNDTILRLAGTHADALQFHIYLTPRVASYTKLEGQPHQVTPGMRLADTIPARLAALEAAMHTHLGRALPVFVTEFGMGNAMNREFMTSVASPVLVADIWRHLIEAPLIAGANKWCLYNGYWFSQVQGPSASRPETPYSIRPEQVYHVIQARCRGPVCLPVTHTGGEGAKAVVFQRPDSYGVVITSREAVEWQSVDVRLPGMVPGQGTCLLLTAGHPFLGNENDRDLVRGMEFRFAVDPAGAFLVPPNSVMGLILPRSP